jgi:hypothetical protein
MISSYGVAAAPTVSCDYVARVRGLSRVSDRIHDWNRVISVRGSVMEAW